MDHNYAYLDNKISIKNIHIYFKRLIIYFISGKTTTLNKMWWVIQDIWSLKINELGTEINNTIFSNI